VVCIHILQIPDLGVIGIVADGTERAVGFSFLLGGAGLPTGMPRGTWHQNRLKSMRPLKNSLGVAPKMAKIETENCQQLLTILRKVSCG
jgi:hypothetical protein